jgi:hypothetical protein
VAILVDAGVLIADERGRLDRERLAARAGAETVATPGITTSEPAGGAAPRLGLALG